MKKIIVVTGAASGLGKEFLIQYTKDRKFDEVWAIDRDKEGLNKLKELLEIPVVPFVIDLSNQKEIEKYQKTLEDEKPNILLLGNFAGYGKFDHSENIDLDTKLNMIDVNVKAPISMMDYSLPYMKKGSIIVNIASYAAFQPVPYIADYAATKSFVLSYSRALNRELKYRGIHVLSVTPFWTKTNFFERAVIKEKKPVVLKYSVMYEATDVVKKMIKDLEKNKEVSTYGALTKSQKLLVKLLPHSLVMDIWMNQQKYDGTPKIR